MDEPAPGCCPAGRTDSTAGLSGHGGTDQAGRRDRGLRHMGLEPRKRPLCTLRRRLIRQRPGKPANGSHGCGAVRHRSPRRSCRGQGGSGASGHCGRPLCQRVSTGVSGRVGSLVPEPWTRRVGRARLRESGHDHGHYRREAGTRTAESKRGADAPGRNGGLLRDLGDGSRKRHREGIGSLGGARTRVGCERREARGRGAGNRAPGRPLDAGQRCGSGVRHGGAVFSRISRRARARRHPVAPQHGAGSVRGRKAVAADRRLHRHHEGEGDGRGGGSRQPREERFPGQHEPRNSHADERHRRDDQPAASEGSGRGNRRFCRDDPELLGRAAHPHQRLPRFLEDRIRPNRPGRSAVRSGEVCRRRRRPFRRPGGGEET